ncbi:glucose-methanol-choline oxidoreductase [Altericroceibacterium spongiae]|uniref:Glucose-methanol-choline oxidoreductase n=1 Tax=Altericroceibacterium spongiae TaxID=2320269 RepID=A0A420EFD2_9SPHN|nr:GMC family oxidoreductase N-terminal domain-containing protein [Altericroceibacterium spongiae]RKF19392.1 glucose-methanol-choline oxidoreductase [Altericroceibacterium spongiae]
MSAKPDYIVVGGGSSGAVVAARLSEDPAIRVALIEAGRNEKAIKLVMPLAFPQVMADKRYNWNYQGEEEPHANNRRLRQPRGKGLGGSSLINGMLYARGHARDYDEWRQLGLAGWGYDDVLPFFKKSEDHWGPEDHYHGKGGPLTISKHPATMKLHPVFEQTLENAGYRYMADYHGAEQEGWSTPDLSVHDGTRGSTAARFLRPAMRRSNLKVITGAYVTKIEVENGRAIAVHFNDGTGPKRLSANREIILSGGTFNTPQLMMLSGIGPAEELREHGIDVVHDLPGVGRNLQDHPSIAMIYRAQHEYTLNPDLRIDRMALSVLRWMTGHKGLIASLPVIANGFVKTRPELERPDAQCLFQPTTIMARLWGPLWRKHIEDTVAMACVQLRPESRGWVKLASADPQQPPRILTNILSTEGDRAFFRRVIPQMRALFATPPLAELLSGETFPGPGVESEQEMDDWLRNAVNTAMHPVGTCAMGTGTDAVCDEKLRVRGIEGLRIADASVMPRIVGGNTNAACIMIGERAADFLRQA